MLIFVTGRNKRAIEDHFDRNPELEAALIKSQKFEQANMVREIIPKDVECVFVRQPEPLGLGHAVLCAQNVIGNEPFAVLLADDFLVTDINQSVTQQLSSAYEKTGNSQLSTIRVKGPDISNYGVVIPDIKKNKILGLVEKPEFSSAPSEMASIGRYVLSHKIFEYIRNTRPGANNEIQLADAIDKMAKDIEIDYLEFNGVRHDCGSMEGYLDAIIMQSRKSLDSEHSG
jgi:UTP--glucose-1-phosphate uridylyltransferase